MADIVITGASRGIGRALALALGTQARLLLTGRDEGRLGDVAAQVRRSGGRAETFAGDLGTVAGARLVAGWSAAAVEPGATLVFNAGVWPARREVGPDGLERAFAVNTVAPLVLAMQLLATGRVRRVVGIGAGLMIRGRFDAGRTPVGEDFSALRTYATTKLAFAVTMRCLAEAHPDVDVAVVHPGVVRTDLGARGGPLGWLLVLVKRRWESPSACAARLVRLFGRDRLATRGAAAWYMGETRAPWPTVVEEPALVAGVRRATEAVVGEGWDLPSKGASLRAP